MCLVEHTQWRYCIMICIILLCSFMLVFFSITNLSNRKKSIENRYFCSEKG